MFRRKCIEHYKHARKDFEGRFEGIADRYEHDEVYRINLHEKYGDMSLEKAKDMDAIARDAEENPVVKNIPWHERQERFAGFQRLRSNQQGGVTVRVADHPEFRATVQAAPQRTPPKAEPAKGSDKARKVLSQTARSHMRDLGARSGGALSRGLIGKADGTKADGTKEDGGDKRLSFSG
jgi:hypothetical protein